jgi:hypothetical protein
MRVSNISLNAQLLLVLVIIGHGGPLVFGSGA